MLSYICWSSSWYLKKAYTTSIFLFKASNENIKATCKICLKLTVKKYNIKINLKDVNVVLLVSLLLTLDKFYKSLWCSFVPICTNIHQSTQCYQSKNWLTKKWSTANREGDYAVNLMLEMVQQVTYPSIYASVFYREHMELFKNLH